MLTFLAYLDLYICSNLQRYFQSAYQSSEGSGKTLHLVVAKEISNTVYMFVCVYGLLPSQQFFSHVGLISCLSGLNPYEDTTQYICTSGESRTTVPSNTLPD